MMAQIPIHEAGFRQMVLARIAIIVAAISAGWLLYFIAEAPAASAPKPANLSIQPLAAPNPNIAPPLTGDIAAKTMPTEAVPASIFANKTAAFLPDPIITPMPPVFRRDYQIPSEKYPLPAPGTGAPLLWRVPTDQPVVFLTIDDGMVKDPRTLQFMQDHNLIATLFLADNFIDGNYAYFAAFQQAGFGIQNHTLHHSLDLYKQPYEIQRAEICGAADLYTQQFGRRPVLYRPPGGNYTAVTQHAAADCGMKAVVIWHAKADGGAMQWQDTDHLLPGDIVLMHFRPKIIEDLTAFTEAMQRAGLKTALLDDWFE